jgi:hypothetical protein
MAEVSDVQLAISFCLLHLSLLFTSRLNTWGLFYASGIYKESSLRNLAIDQWQMFLISIAEFESEHFYACLMS